MIVCNSSMSEMRLDSILEGHSSRNGHYFVNNTSRNTRIPMFLSQKAFKCLQAFRLQKWSTRSLIVKSKACAVRHYKKALIAQKEVEAQAAVDRKDAKTQYRIVAELTGIWCNSNTRQEWQTSSRGERWKTYALEGTYNAVDDQEVKLGETGVAVRWGCAVEFWQSSCPEWWKEGVIVKLPKKIIVCGNWRCFTLLSLLGKAFCKTFQDHYQLDYDKRIQKR